MHYLQYLLAVIGIGYFITLSDLCKPLRMKVSALNKKEIKGLKFFIDKLDGVVNCIYCASFWIGIGVYYLTYNEISRYTIFFSFSCMGLIYVVKNIFSK